MYDPKLHHRRSIRLRGYDYSSPGSYFVTICANDHVHLFGEIIEGVPHLNDGGKMIESAWTQMPDNYPNCQIGDFVIMPNHLHGIIILDPTVGAPSARTTREQEAGEAQRQWQVQGPGQAQGPAPTTLGLGDLVHRFKSLTTARYRQGTATHGWPRLNGRLWQRNYYEHIVRNDDELAKIREYIATNPLRWETDWENILGAGTSR